MEADLKCPACSKPFTLSRLPIKSPCKHTTCNKCIFQSCSNNSFHCPMCRASTPVTADKLPINHEMYRSLMKHISSRCKEHNKHHHWYCCDCTKLLCKRCVSHHTRHSFIDLDDKSLAAMIADKVAATDAKLKEPLAELSEYAARLHVANEELDGAKMKIQQDISQKVKHICVRVKTVAKESLRQLDCIHSEAKATLVGLIASAEEEQTRWKESYHDFCATSASMKTLDVCSQLKFVDKLSAWPAFEPRDREEAEKRLEELAQVEEEFDLKVLEAVRADPQPVRTPKHSLQLTGSVESLHDP